jgi:hypothetical protein
MYIEIKKYDISEEQILNKAVLYYCHLIVSTSNHDDKLAYSEDLMKLVNYNLWFLDVYPDFNSELCSKIKHFHKSKAPKTKEFGKKWLWITTRQPGKDIAKAYDIRISPTSRFN